MADTYVKIVTDTVNQNVPTKATFEKAFPKSTVITLTAAGWNSSNQQTVTVSGVLANEAAQLIIPVPAMASLSAYQAAGILCTAQATNSLTFTCTTKPTANITVYITIQDVK